MHFSSSSTPPPHFLATLMKYYTAKDIKWYLKKLTRGVLTYFLILICQFLCLLYMALAGHSGYVCEDAFFMFSSTVWANKIHNQFVNKIFSVVNYSPELKLRSNIWNGPCIYNVIQFRSQWVKFLTPVKNMI